MSLIGASTALAAGPVIGGILIATLGWNSSFFINLPIGAAGLFLMLRVGRETPRLAGHGIDLPGQIAAILALGSLATGTIEGGALGWTSPVAAGASRCSRWLAIAFVLIETHTRSAMLPLELFRRPTFSASTATGLLVNVCFYGLIFVFSLLFQRSGPLSAGHWTGLVADHRGDHPRRTVRPCDLAPAWVWWLRRSRPRCSAALIEPGPGSPRER